MLRLVLPDRGCSPFQSFSDLTTGSSRFRLCVKRERLLSSRERESGFLFFTENGHALGHFLERSTQIDVALQQSALISRQALTAPARQWRSAANLEQYNGRGDSMTG